MEVITINERKYQVLTNYKDAINIEELEEKITEYFDDFDYIVDNNMSKEEYLEKIINIVEDIKLKMLTK